MEVIDWNEYRGFKADFIHPKNRQAGWQYGAEIIGMDPVLIDGMESVKVKDIDGNYILIPIEIATRCILLHSKETPENLVD